MAKPPFPAPAPIGLVVAAAIAAVALPRPALSQVIEIGADGSIAVYDRPSVFTTDGAAPIEPPEADTQREPRPGGSAAAPAAQAAVKREIAAAASAYALSPALIEAVAWRESRFRHDAVSRTGATGVMQLMPGTARDLGVDRFDLRQNIHGGAAYLSRMVNQFGGDLTLGLAAYNAGPGAVRRWGGVPPYAETRNYVAAILDRLAVRATQTIP